MRPVTRVVVAMVIFAATIIPVRQSAAYDESCGMYAQFLWSAADQYESAKSSYESACSPYYGYSKNDEFACGPYGYERSAYESAKEELESAISNVGISCGVSDAALHALRAAYEKRILELEAKLKESERRLKDAE